MPSLSERADLVRDRIVRVKDAFSSSYSRTSVSELIIEFKQVKHGFCSFCGLHEHPGDCLGGTLRGWLDMSSPEDKARFKAFHLKMAEEYGAALRSLTDDELLQMPLPVKAIRLKLIVAELDRRIKIQRKQHSRWATLSGKTPKESCSTEVQARCRPIGVHFRCAP